MNKQEVKQQIKFSIDKLADLILELNSEPMNYDKYDLMNVNIVFNHIFKDLMLQFYKDKLNEKQLKKIATELSENFRQNILVGTGINLVRI